LKRRTIQAAAGVVVRHLVAPHWMRAMVAVGQQFPEKQPRADFMPATRAARAPHLNDPGMCEPGYRMTRHIDDTSARQINVV